MHRGSTCLEKVAEIDGAGCLHTLLNSLNRGEVCSKTSSIQYEQVSSLNFIHVHKVYPKNLSTALKAKYKNSTGQVFSFHLNNL